MDPVPSPSSESAVSPHAANANFLKPSLAAAGLDPDHLPPREELQVLDDVRAWKTIWSAGHGVGGVTDSPPVSELCDRLVRDYREALTGVAGDPFLMRG